MLAFGAVIGWLATQDPPPDALPYHVLLPVETPVVVAEAPAETVDAEGTDTTITMTEVDQVSTDGGPDAAPGAEESSTEPETVVAEMPMPVIGPTSLRGIGLGERASTMQPAPHPLLVEQGRHGLMPIISADGRESWQVYARPFDDADPRPLVALVVTGLGMSQAKTHKVLQLPGAVTLAFSPYAEGLSEWIRQARAAGHEILLEVPMEPPSYPSDDPGPRALMTSLGPAQNSDRLDWLLGRFQGYVGLLQSMGGRFAASPLHLEPVLETAKRRGLMYVDLRRGVSSLSSEMAGQLDLLQVGADIEIDADPAPHEIERRLSAAENRAQRTGSAVLVAHPYPITVDTVLAWIDTLEEKGVALAPLTAVAARQATSRE